MDREVLAFCLTLLILMNGSYFLYIIGKIFYYKTHYMETFWRS